MSRTVVLSARVPDDLAEFLERSAAARGVRRSWLLEAALVSFMERVEAGWEPDLPPPKPKPWGHKVTIVAYVPGELDEGAVDRAVEAVDGLLDADFVGVYARVEREQPADQVAS